MNKIHPKSMANLVNRVIIWNNCRYDRVPSYNLAYTLLNEEYNEYLKADTTVLKLDAYGDLMFVGIGMLWKFGHSAEQITKAMLMIGEYLLLPIFEFMIDKIIDKSWSFDFIYIYNNSATHWKEYKSIVIFLSNIITKVYKDLYKQYGKLINYHSHSILLAICNSNDTKIEPLTKCDPAIKSNINKGPLYIPPTEHLTKITKYLDENK